jgi:hypothetical protein
MYPTFRSHNRGGGNHSQHVTKSVFRKDIFRRGPGFHQRKMAVGTFKAQAEDTGFG